MGIRALRGVRMLQFGPEGYGGYGMGYVSSPPKDGYVPSAEIVYYLSGILKWRILFEFSIVWVPRCFTHGFLQSEMECATH